MCNGTVAENRIWKLRHWQSFALQTFVRRAVKSKRERRIVCRSGGLPLKSPDGRDNLNWAATQYKPFQSAIFFFPIRLSALVESKLALRFSAAVLLSKAWAHKAYNVPMNVPWGTQETEWSEKKWKSENVHLASSSEKQIHNFWVKLTPVQDILHAHRQLMVEIVSAGELK